MIRRRISIRFFTSVLVFSILSIFSGSLCFGIELDEIKNMIRAKGHRWVAGETSVSKLSHFHRKMLCGHLRPQASVSPPPEVYTQESVTALPATLDWRNMDGQSFVTPVRNQGNCGSCWAFATTAALESYILIKDNFPAADNNRAEEILLSCCSNCIPPGYGTCEGGYVGSAAEYIRGTGLPPESSFPYSVVSTDDKCSNAQNGWQTSASRIDAWSWVTTSSVSVSAIKAALANGPLVTTLDVYEDFYTYKSGIYEYARGDKLGGHAVLIVGYADDASVNGGGYFIVKNSWGTGWGMAGYFNIAYSQTGSPVGFGEYTIAYQQAGIPPAAPSRLAAAALSASSIMLTWSDNSQNETGFKIEMCAGSDCTNLVQTATVGSNTTTYTRTGLQAGTVYTFRVRANNASGDSTYSNEAVATTLAPPTAPSAPTNLTGISVSKTQIRLSWTDTSNNENGFKIERCAGSTCTNFKQIVSVGANVTHYNNTGFKMGTTYRYRIRSYNLIGASAYSNQVNVTAVARPPYAPTGLSGVAASQALINLSWADVSDNETGFKIERCIGSACSRFSQIGSVKANVIQYSDARLKKKATYKYRVRAYNCDGNSSYSGIITIQTPK